MRIRLVTTSRHDTQIRFRFRDGVDEVTDFRSDAKEVAVRYGPSGTVIWAGLGDRKEHTPHVLRSAAAVAARVAVDLKRPSVSLVLGGLRTPEAAVEGVLLGTYVFDRYLSEKVFRLQDLDVVASRLTRDRLVRSEIVCDAVCYARDLVNDNADSITPRRLAKEARTIGAAPGFTVTVLSEKEICRRGMHLLAAVGQGSPHPPRLLSLSYRGNARDKRVVAIVGKGVTFDSGGLNVKPSGHIETMRLDMAGAATVLAVMKAISRLRPRINVVGVCAAAHNAVDGKSYMPGDIYRSYSGKTVEVCNTDAEGRLVLADAITYARRAHKPDEIIDLATLTGGILATFADVVCGLFSNDEALAGRLVRAGEETNERLWRLPLYREYSEAMKGERSDLRNLAKFKRGHASSITGAAFLKEFAEDTPWAHLDIAGTAFNEGEARGEIPKLATGFGVRLLVDYLTRTAGAGARRRRGHRRSTVRR